MRFRRAIVADIPQISALETLPQFRTLVGSWAQDLHVRTLADPDAAYIVAEEKPDQVIAFALLRGLRSEHRSVELKRLVVGVPDQGTGRKLLSEVAERAFGELGAHRLYLDVFVNNARARHVYKTFGFLEEGMMRDAIYRDGTYHSLILMSLLENEYRKKADKND